MSEHEEWVAILQGGESSAALIDPQSAALIVVDMQRYFTQPSFPFTDVFDKLSPGVTTGYLNRVQESVIPNIQVLLRRFRDLNAPVFFTAVGTKNGMGDDLSPWLRSFDALGVATIGTRIFPPVDDPSWEIDKALEPRPDEQVLNKLTAGTFASTDLDQRLRDRNVQSVVVVGVATDVCVSTTAREAADRGFKVVTVSDACTTLSDQLHGANLDTLRVFGSVRTTSEVVKALRESSRDG